MVITFFIGIIALIAIALFAINPKESTESYSRQWRNL